MTARQTMTATFRFEGIVNLDELKSLLASATPGPWRHKPFEFEGSGAIEIPEVFWSYDLGENDASLIVALRNAAPALIAELEAAQETNEVLMNKRLTYDGLESSGPLSVEYYWVCDETCSGHRVVPDKCCDNAHRVVLLDRADFEDIMGWYASWVPVKNFHTMSAELEAARKVVEVARHVAGYYMHGATMRPDIARVKLIAALAEYDALRNDK